MKLRIEADSFSEIEKTLHDILAQYPQQSHITIELECTRGVLQKLDNLDDGTAVISNTIINKLDLTTPAGTKDTYQKLANTHKKPDPHELLERGWVVFGPHNYGSKTRGQKLGVRIQDPRNGVKYRVYCLPEIELHAIVAAAQIKGLYRQKDTLEPLTDAQEAKAMDAMVTRGVTYRAIVCQTCGKEIGKYPDNRFALSEKNRLIKAHEYQTGHSVK